MKTRTCFLGWIGAVLLVGMSSVGWAQDKAVKEPDPYAFSIRVYRLPTEEVTFTSWEGRKVLPAPDLPPANATAGEQKLFLRNSHELVKGFLSEQGVTLPKGSLVCFDPASGTLALRSMTVVHDLVEHVSKALLDHRPSHLNWALDIVEAPASAVRAAMKDATGKSDHAAVFDRLLPQGKLAVTMRGETKPGQRTSARQGRRIESASEYKIDAQQRLSTQTIETNVGIELDMDPTIDTDRQVIQVNFALTHRYTPPMPRWAALTTGPDKVMEARWMDFPLGKVQTSVDIPDGATRLVGVWTLEGTPEPERVGAMQAAFLRFCIVRSQPLENRRVEEILKAYGEAVEPTANAERPLADPSPPHGMIVRRFKVPSDFLSMGQDSEAAPSSPRDPFNVKESLKKPRSLDRVTAEDVLKNNGIPFPDGASANYLTAISELVVRNTPANIDMVETYVEPLDAHQFPKTLAFTLHIVQADAALIRRLDRETMTLPDHAAAWKEIQDAAEQGKAKIVRSLWLETKSGQRASTENIIEYARNTGAELKATSSASETRPDDAKAAPGAKATAVTGSNERLLTASAETEPVGLRMELDPTLGSDGYTIDLNLDLNYDYAPPLQTLVKEPLPEHTQRLATPTNEFRHANMQTATTLLSGATRLLSIWKPTGTPEFAGDILQAAFLRAEVVWVELTSAAR